MYRSVEDFSHRYFDSLSKIAVFRSFPIGNVSRVRTSSHREFGILEVRTSLEGTPDVGFKNPLGFECPDT